MHQEQNHNEQRNAKKTDLGFDFSESISDGEHVSKVEPADEPIAVPQQQPQTYAPPQAAQQMSENVVNNGTPFEHITPAGSSRDYNLWKSKMTLIDNASLLARQYDQEIFVAFYDQQLDKLFVYSSNAKFCHKDVGSIIKLTALGQRQNKITVYDNRLND